MARTVTRFMPRPARRLLGTMLSSAVRIRRDYRSIEDSFKNGATVAIGNSLASFRPKPDICAVFAGRNDDYVVDNEARIRAVIEWNSNVLCDEVVFVEWNPLPDRPLLSPKLTRDYKNLRCFVVSSEIHNRLCGNPRMPVMEYFAKNVGIRRARAEFVCATNADILWDANVRRMKWFLNKRI